MTPDGSGAANGTLNGLDAQAHAANGWLGQSGDCLAPGKASGYVKYLSMYVKYLLT